MKTLFSILILVTIISCNSNDAAVIVKSATSTPKAAPAGPYIPVVKQGMEGYYTGIFKDENNDDWKKMTLRIDSLSANKIYGWSIVSGNERPISGTVKRSGATINVSANEPGDDKHDGKFYFVYYPETKMIEGDWFANDSALKKSYKLEKRAFKYDPTLKLTEDIVGQPLENTYLPNSDKAESLTKDVLRINPSMTLLKKENVENMYRTDLEVLRNSIYARHGYSFKNSRMRQVFDYNTDWYMPVSADVTAQLTSLEQKNIELIKRYEAHAAKYYKYFGR